MTQKVKIEKNVPVPKDAKGRKGRGVIAEPLRALLKSAKGSSVLIKDATVAQVNPVANYVGGAGWYTCRQDEDNVRVWKV